MAVFYILPPRQLLGEALATALRPFVPGVAINEDACADLVDSLVTGSPDMTETYIVHREELPDDEDLSVTLREGFGAEAGDKVVLVTIGPRPDSPRVRTWKLEAA